MTPDQPPMSNDSRSEVPPIHKDISFWGMAATQFLGAFNDSVFKQLVLLICVASPIIANLESVTPVTFSTSSEEDSPQALPLRGTGKLSGSDQQNRWRVVAQANSAYNLVLVAAADAPHLKAEVFGPNDQLVSAQDSQADIGTLRTQWTSADEGEYQIVVSLDQPAAAANAGTADYELKVAQARDLQAVAMGVFAIPFILFSGFAGFLSDRSSKRKIIVLCKVAEIVIMASGMVAFAVLFAGGFWAILVILFMMGAQSAYFGPSKYGILPEMLHDHDLPVANGVLQTTTFVALIFGIALAGVMKEYLHAELWKAGLICAMIAVAGTLTSLLVRKVKVAKPGLKFSPSALAIPSDTWKLIRSDRGLMLALGVNSLFWFMAAIVQPSVNALGERQLHLSATNTSLMAASMGIGIAIGCLVAGFMSNGKISFGLVRAGSTGMAVCLALMTLGGSLNDGLLSGKMDNDQAVASNSVPSAAVSPQPVEPSLQDASAPPSGDSGNVWMAFAAVLCALGFCAGLFAVPLQVYLQAHPPKDQKGRMIGSMNLINWIAILVASGMYEICRHVLMKVGLPPSAIFGLLSLLLLPVAIFYRPTTEQLD